MFHGENKTQNTKSETKHTFTHHETKTLFVKNSLSAAAGAVNLCRWDGRNDQLLYYYFF